MANDVGIRVGIEGEKQFRDSLKGINSQLKNLNTELDASAQKFKNSANSEEALEEKTDILSRTIDAQKKKIELLTTQYDNQIKKLSALGDELDKVSEEFGKNSDQAAKAQTAYNRQATQVNNLGSQLNTAKSDLSRFEEQMRTASDRSIRFSEDLKSAASKLDKFSSKASSIGNTLTLGVTTPILGAGLASFKYASDLEENLNKTEVAFKENSDEVIEWSKTTLKQYGLSQSTALNMASTWGDMGTSMEIPLDTATEMSKTLVGLSADLASFKNISIDRAQTALNAVYTGETESLKELGVVMTEANLEAYAMAKGTEKSYKEMDQAEKVSLRYQYVLDKTQNSQGDFARTSDSAANQMRIAQESAKELAAEFGKKLLPAGTKILEFANDLLDSFNNLDDGTQNLIISISGIAAAAGPATKLLGGITGVAGKVAGGIGGLISKIKDLDNAQKNAKTSTSNLSSVISGLANPTTGAITLAVGAFGIYMYWLGEMMFKENEYIEQSKEKNKQLDNQIEKLKQISEESEIAVSQIKSESDYYQTLYDEMQLLVDANGNIKSGYEDRVEYILGELSQAYGVESELVNGVITDYENLKQSIENASTSSMAQKLLEEYDDDYSEAIKTISETEKSMNDYLMEAEKLQQEYNEYLAENTDSLGRFWGDKEQLHELGQNAEYARQQYEEYAKTYQDQQAIIDRVDSARMAAMNGNYQEAVNILDNTVDKREQASKSLYQIGLEELTTERERNKQLLEEYERTGSESVKISLDASNERIAILEQSLVDSLDTVKENEVPYMTILSELANAGTKGYTSNLNFKAPTLEQIELLKQAIESESPYVSAAAQNVAKNATNALSSEDENMQRAGAELIEYFANGISSEDEETREKTAAISGVISSTLDIAPELFNIGKNNGESYMEGFESAVNTIGNTVASILSSNPNSWSRQSYSPAAYSAPQMAPASASLMSVSENAPALFSNELSEETAPLISMVKSRVAFLDISDDMYDAGVKMANSIERGIRANIMPERQEISVVMPSGSTGTTLNQTNNFYSPEALSPAETARLNRVNVRRTIQALR